jgi:hypothetical protein
MFVMGAVLASSQLRRRQYMRKTQVFLGSLAMACCMWAVTGFAQNTNSADLRGTVTDPKGSVLAGATITVKDIEKDQSRSYTTDAAGLYDTGPIVPDHYLVTISAPGFKSLVRGPINLTVGNEALNAQLQVGAVQEQVIVNSDLPLLDTESGTQSNSLENADMAELPQYGSDWQNFVFLLPGTSFSYRAGQSTSVNGNLPYSSVLSDGATTTLPMSTNSDVTIFETTSEVKIDTNSFSSQYGLGGIIFNQVTKGGGDKFHGTAYEYFQNTALNAADYGFTTTKNQAAFQRFDNYGFSIGGPVLLPYMKKNVFFYFDYDKTYSNGGSGNTYMSVPTDAMRAGDFTGLPTVFDYASSVISKDATGAAVVNRKSYSDEYGNGNKLPANAVLSKVNQQFQKFFPEPNVAGAPTSTNGMPHNNYTTNVPNLVPFIKFFGRLDYTPVANHRFTISETESDNPAVSYGHGKASCPVDCQYQDVSRDNAQVSDVWTISSNMVNEARLGFTDQLNYYSPFSQNEGYPAKMGIKWAVADAIPAVSMMTLSSLSEPINAVYKEMVFDPSDVFTLIKGRHVLHLGGEILISRADSTAWGNETAGSTYYGGYYSDGCLQTLPSGAPNPCWTSTKNTINQQNNDDAEYSDFLLGYSAQWVGSMTPEFGMRMKNPQAFVQDDFKIRPNLTLNIGVRWFGTTGMSETKGNISSFDPAVVNGGSGNDPNGNKAVAQMGGMWYGFNSTNGRKSLQASVYSTFLPRFGFSYSHDAKTVLRGGIGLYNYTWSEDTYGGGMGSAFGGSGSAWDPSNGIYYQLLADSDGTTNYEGTYGMSVQNLWTQAPTTPYAKNGKGVTFTPYHTPVPKIWQYNLTLQRQIGSTMMGQVAYVGSRGFDLAFLVDMNQITQNNMSATDNTPGTNKRPFPLFTSIGGNTNNGISNYNSLQGTFQKRLSHGLTADASYTWSKFLDTMDSAGWGSSVGTQVYQSSYCPKCNWGPSNFDVRQVLSFDAIYTLPFGKGAQFFNHNVIADEVIGGWRLALTSRENTGSPFTPTMNTNTSYAQAGNQFPNLIGSPMRFNSRSISNWFDKGAYTAPTIATFGNVHRNSLYGPHYSNLDLSFGKTFNLYKSKLEVRADAKNSLNHPSFGGPDSSIGNANPAWITSVTDGGRHVQLYGRFSF